MVKHAFIIHDLLVLREGESCTLNVSKQTSVYYSPCAALLNFNVTWCMMHYANVSVWHLHMHCKYMYYTGTFDSLQKSCWYYSCIHLLQCSLGNCTMGLLKRVGTKTGSGQVLYLLIIYITSPPRLTLRLHHNLKQKGTQFLAL